MNDDAFVNSILGYDRESGYQGMTTCEMGHGLENGSWQARDWSWRDFCCGHLFQGSSYEETKHWRYR